MTYDVRIEIKHIFNEKNFAPNLSTVHSVSPL